MTAGFICFLALIAVVAFLIGSWRELRKQDNRDRRRRWWFWFCIRWGDIGRQYAQDHLNNVKRGT